MKIPIIGGGNDGGEIDSDKLPDVDAGLVDLINNSPIKEFANKTKSAYYLWARGQSKNCFTMCNYQNNEDLAALINSLSASIYSASGGKLSLALIKNDDDSNKGDSWKKAE